LNSVVRADASDLEIVQRGTDVLVVDRADALVRVLDPAGSTLGDPIALPPEQAEVRIAGDRAIVHAAGTGELWIVPLGSIDDFNAAAEPDLEFGLGSKLAVGPDGAVFVYWAETGSVVRVDPAGSGEIVARWEVELGEDDEE